MGLDGFHPAVVGWFASRFASPSEVQARAWPAIRSGRHTLIAAPTGSGKTLAAFLAALDDLVRHGLEGRLGDETHVVYVSPLKALSNDIERNLQEPLAGIRRELAGRGLPDVEIRTFVRTGDTKAAAREAMARRPPGRRRSCRRASLTTIARGSTRSAPPGPCARRRSCWWRGATWPRGDRARRMRERTARRFRRRRQQSTLSSPGTERPSSTIWSRGRGSCARRWRKRWRNSWRGDG